MDELVKELVGKCRRMRDNVEMDMSDDTLLVDLGKQLDAMLGATDEALSMEVYTFVVMRAFRLLKEEV